MKTIFKSSILLLAIAALIPSLQSCKPKDGAPKPVRIQNVVPQDIIDNLRNQGMRINEGNRPPNLELSIQVSPMKLLVPAGEEDHFKKEQTIQDYFYKFYGQTDKQEISYDSNSLFNNHTATAQGAFIIGEDNRFTIFSEQVGDTKGIPNKSVTIISGILEGKTIKEFQYGFILTEKTGDDNNEKMISVGKGRIWIDGDGISGSTSNLRTATPHITRSETATSAH